MSGCRSRCWPFLCGGHAGRTQHHVRLWHAYGEGMCVCVCVCVCMSIICMYMYVCVLMWPLLVELCAGMRVRVWWVGVFVGVFVWGCASPYVLLRECVCARLWESRCGVMQDTHPPLRGQTRVCLRRGSLQRRCRMEELVHMLIRQSSAFMMTHINSLTDRRTHADAHPYTHGQTDRQTQRKMGAHSFPMTPIRSCCDLSMKCIHW